MTLRSHPEPEPGAAAGRRHPRPKPGPAAGRSNPRSVAAQAQEGLEELSALKVRNGGSKEIPLIQGKEQRLCFAGAAVKRYPTSKVRETQVRW